MCAEASYRALGVGVRSANNEDRAGCVMEHVVTDRSEQDALEKA